MAIQTDIDDINNDASIANARANSNRKSRFAQFMRVFRHDPRWWCGIVLLLFVLVAILAPIISPYSPTLYHPAVATQGPTAAHLLGTDALGRDQLSRVFWGARISLAGAL